jgi:hypothetical protein
MSAGQAGLSGPQASSASMWSGFQACLIRPLYHGEKRPAISTEDGAGRRTKQDNWYSKSLIKFYRPSLHYLGDIEAQQKSQILKGPVLSGLINGLPLPRLTVPCTALHCTALHCTALHCPTLPKGVTFLSKYFTSSSNCFFESASRPNLKCSRVQ